MGAAIRARCNPLSKKLDIFSLNSSEPSQIFSSDFFVKNASKLENKGVLGIFSKVSLNF